MPPRGPLKPMKIGRLFVNGRSRRGLIFRGGYKVLSLVGDIALDEKGEPKVHAHVVVGRSDGTALGGHLVEAQVRPTLEVVLVESRKHLPRRYDPESKLALIRL
jgi:predicted DNA-binding protein with PD1-like motif